MHSVKLDSWVIGLLVDPISKAPVAEIPRTNGIPDFRVGLSSDWKAGQDAYERWQNQLSANDAQVDYAAEIDSVRGVYADIPLHGSVLDVGGHQGRLREFLRPDQPYLSCDPFIDVFDGLERQPNLLKTYRCMSEPCNFIGATAEHLPIADASFDVVHMRSVLDHFSNAKAAVMEARRVLKPGGNLVIGLSVKHGKRGKPSAKWVAKETLRAVLPYVGITKYTDHHIWHPTFDELTGLVEACGFSVSKVHWQAGTDAVCYIKAINRA